MQADSGNPLHSGDAKRRSARSVAVIGAAAVTLVAGVTTTIVGVGSTTTTTPTPVGDKAKETRAAEAYGRLPINFEVNAGQADADVNFLSRGQGYSLFLTPTEAVVSLEKHASGEKVTTGQAPSREQAVVRMQLLGSNPSATPTSSAPLPGKVNYLTGSDRSQWHTNVPTFGAVAYQGIYPGVDVKYHGTQGQLEYDFVVAPGADPGAIRMGMAGADGVAIAPNGDLVMATPAGELRQHKPVLYQDLSGGRQEISGNFVLLGDHEVGFQVGPHDASAPLVIDPTLVYSTYLGGPANDFGFGIAVDNAGNAYLGGQTGAPIFPRGQASDPAPKGATAGAFQTAFGGGSSDAFVLKMNPAGNALVYATYLGGSRGDAGWDLAIDAAGNAYLGGSTESADDPGTAAVEAGFPTTNGTGGTVAAFDSTCGSDGTCNDVLPPNFFAPACDPLEPACNPADPSSPGFLPAVCPAGPNPGCATLPGPADNFLSKLSPAGDKLLYSTLYGGAGAEQNTEEVPYPGQLGVALKGSTAYLTSFTYSSDFPITAKAFQPTCASCADGNNDSYLTVIDTTKGGTAGLVYSTYVGGSGFDEGKGVAVDKAGNAYLTGVITGVDSSPGSTTFPVKTPLGGTYLGSGAYSGGSYHGGYTDAYVTSIDPFAKNAADSLQWSSFLGGGGKEEGWSIAVGEGNKNGAKVYVTGYTTSGPNPHAQVADPAHPGACAAAPDPIDGTRHFCDFASDPAPYFPVTAGAYQTTYSGRATTDSGSTLFLDGDAFVTKIFKNGTALDYSTFLGGPNGDLGQSIAVDSLGQAYVTGWTTCRNQDPSAHGNDQPPAGDSPSDHPPPQFDPDGVPTGRNPGEPAQTGVSDCPTGFPTVDAPPGLDVMNSTSIDNHTNDSPTAAFVSKLLPDGNGVVYSVLLDGRGFDRGFSIAVRETTAGAEAYVAGRTGNPSFQAWCVPTCAFPVTAGSYDTTYNGAGRDAFITKLVG